MLTLVKFCTLLGQVRKQSIMMRLMKDGTWAFAIIFGAFSARLRRHEVVLDETFSVAMLLNTLMYNIEKNTLTGTFYL